MFCLYCGAEAPTRGTTCPVCGRDLGRSSADLRSSSALSNILESADSSPSPTYLTELRGEVAPSVRAGDLDQPSFPRDGIGRALLIVVLALEADLLLPWRVVQGQHQTLPALNGLIIGCLILAGGLPLLHPQLRRSTIFAALPLGIGGILFGIGLAFWMNLGSVTYNVVPISGVRSSPSSSAPGRVVYGIAEGRLVASTAGPDFGLLVFLLGAIVLVGIGYVFFLGAARSPVAPKVEADAALHSPPHAQTSPAIDIAETKYASEVAAKHTPNPPSASPPDLALPGSESWNQAVESPVLLRPQTGGIRRPAR